MRPEDRPFTFASRLHDTAARWLQPAPMPEEMQVLNTVMLEQFVEGLPIGMADWVRCHWPASLEATNAGLGPPGGMMGTPTRTAMAGNNGPTGPGPTKATN